MIEYVTSTVISNKQIAKDIFDMILSFHKDLSNVKAGQFAQIFVPKGEHLLPRPISICEIGREEQTLRFVYQVVGKGTEYFSKLVRGDELKVLAPLGNGFNIVDGKKEIAIVGGGVGVPPMLELAKTIKQQIPDANISVFLGFRSELFLIEDFAKLGVKLQIATDDGNIGFKGNVVELMNSINYKSEVVYACGPKPMLKALNDWSCENDSLCFVSMEERMACGIGACVGCAIPIKTKSDDYEYKKVCKDGPVFDSMEVAWNEH